MLAEAAQDGPRSRAHVALLAVTGARVSEVLGLDVADISMERRHRTVAVTRKGWWRQTLSVPPLAAEALETVLEELGRAGVPDGCRAPTHTTP